MKINIFDISAAGVDFKEKLDAAALGVETEFIRYVAPLDIHVSAERMQDIVNLNIEVTSEQELTCHRCLDTYEGSLFKRILLTYTADKNQTVDTAEHVREEILLDYPVRLLCKQDCRGICPRCGMNLNRRECVCHE